MNLTPGEAAALYQILYKMLDEERARNQEQSMFNLKVQPQMMLNSQFQITS